jgi:hypothetical protein
MTTVLYTIPTGSPTLDWMKENHIPMTWDNWLSLAWGPCALEGPT